MAGRIGKIRSRITVQSPSYTSDEAGGYTQNWSEVATMWAYIKPRRTWEKNAESIRADQLSSTVDYQITLRWRNDVEPKMRIIYNNRKFHILTTFDLDGRKRWLTCVCEERNQ